MNYDYEYISKKIPNFDDTFIIGKTILNRLIYCISIGKGIKCGIFCAAFHGLEYLTAAALLEFANEFTLMKQYHNNIRLFIIPMVNPDGVDIAVNGINPSNTVHQNLINHTGIIDFTAKWQANAMGVDINHNFDADWSNIYNIPQPTKYGGEYPESELETKSLVKFINIIKPELFIAFHSQGKEIYYDFNGMENKRAKTTAKKIGKRSGYTVSKPTGTASFGGAKDWFIKEFHKQAFTIELGLGKNPLNTSQLPEMTADCKKICLAAIDEVLC